MKKILIDAHTHTVASGHAYSSLQEMAKAAAEKGLEVLGLTFSTPKGHLTLQKSRSVGST